MQYPTVDGFSTSIPLSNKHPLEIQSTNAGNGSYANEAGDAFAEGPLKKKFRCEVCNKGFEQPQSLTCHCKTSAGHMRRTGVQPKHLSQCPYCDEKFTRLDDVGRHIGRRHKDKTSWFPTLQDGRADAKDEMQVDNSGLDIQHEDSMNGALTHGDPTAQVEVEARTLHNDTFVTVPQPTTLSVVEPMAEDKQTEHATPTNCEESAADSFTLPEYPDILYQPLDELAATIGRLELCNTRPRCVECKQRLGFDEVPLRLHLERHKREHEHPNHKCDECGVHFVYIKDLRYHQHTAFTGYCGFPFDHVDECTGHHSSSKTAQSDHRPFVDGVRVQEHWRLQRLIQQLRDVEIKRTIMDPQDGRVLTDRHRWSWAGLRHRVSQSSIGKISIKSDHSGPAAFNTETLQASLDEVAADLNTHAGHAQLTALRNENKRLLSSLKPRKSRLSETQESISENSMTDGLKKSYLSRQMAAAVKPQHFNRALEPFSQGASLKKFVSMQDHLWTTLLFIELLRATIRELPKL